MLFGAVHSLHPKVISSLRCQSVRVAGIAKRAVRLKKDFDARVYRAIFLRMMQDGPVYGYEIANRFEEMTK
jgi:hypothetical protein